MPTLHQRVSSPENSTLYSGTNHRGIKTFSWLADHDLHDFHLNLLDLTIPLVRKDWIPYESYLGLVEFGTETYYSNGNVTFSASDFAMDLTTTGEIPTLDIPEPEMPGLASCLRIGFLHRRDILAMIGLGYFYLYM